MVVRGMSKRISMLTASMIAAGTLLAVLIPGTAQAQENSRICGNYWEARAGGQVVGLLAKVMEVPKVDGGICRQVIDKADHVSGEKLEGYKGKITWNPRKEIQSWKCEDFGSLLNGKYGNDPCLKMNKVDLPHQVGGRTPSKFQIKY